MLLRDHQEIGYEKNGKKKYETDIYGRDRMRSDRIRDHVGGGFRQK